MSSHPRSIENQNIYEQSVKRAMGMIKKEYDDDLTGGGLFPCVTCEKYFDCDENLKNHLKSKRHKQQLKRLSNIPYSHQEASHAAGMGSYSISLYKSKMDVFSTELAHNFNS
uniref:Zinc finger protein 593 (Trinotate prediction) n=1 Tax=Henneguya salminicola TaxID=69463 RepID=A0A6G3MHG7_HENSL